MWRLENPADILEYFGFGSFSKMSSTFEFSELYNLIGGVIVCADHEFVHDLSPGW